MYTYLACIRSFATFCRRVFSRTSNINNKFARRLRLGLCGTNPISAIQVLKFFTSDLQSNYLEIKNTFKLFILNIDTKTLFDFHIFVSNTAKHCLQYFLNPKTGFYSMSFDMLPYSQLEKAKKKFCVSHHIK